MRFRRLKDVFDILLMRQVNKRLAYAVGYGGVKILMCRIDEEGCGAVICEARLTIVEEHDGLSTSLSSE